MMTRSMVKKEATDSGKRHVNGSPPAVPPKRRNAFGDITNALRNVRITAFGLQSKDNGRSKSVDLKSDKVDQTVPSCDYGTDYDREVAGNPYQVPIYAHEIFEYYRMRELKFRIDDYLKRQPTITINMRSILVDWMVEAQENFEFNHETLYQAVKLTDLYLCKQQTNPKELQLIGTTALLISSKFDERLPPTIDDYLYLCDHAYTKDEIINKERVVLQTVDFDIGFPLSYTFQRRFAKATGITMRTLTLARYILETSLMYYEFVGFLESEMAAASLLLAMEVCNVEWSDQHVQYSKYTRSQLLPTMWKLNAIVGQPIDGIPLTNVKSKYSNSIFFEVANIPLLDGPH